MMQRFYAAAARRLRVGEYKLYPSWEAASKASASYESEDLTTFRLARARAYVPSAELAQRTLLPLVVKNLGIEQGSITDFGGACGETGRSLLTIFPGITYTVVETPGIVAGVDFAAPVRFTTTIPSECDIFFSSGALQCIPDPAGILSAAFNSARRAVILCRNSFCTHPLFRVQRSRLFENGNGRVPDGYTDRIVTYPHRTVDEREVHRIAADHGFGLAASLDERDGVHPYGLDVYGRNLLFERPSLPGSR